MHFDTGNDDMWQKSFAQAVKDGKITNQELNGAHVILCEKPDEQGKRQFIIGLDAAYELMMKDPHAKIIIPTAFGGPDVLEAIAEKKHKKDILTVLKSNPLVKFMELYKSIGTVFDDWNNISFEQKEKAKRITPLYGKQAIHVQSVVEQ